MEINLAHISIICNSIGQPETFRALRASLLLFGMCTLRDKIRVMTLRAYEISHGQLLTLSVQHLILELLHHTITGYKRGSETYVLKIVQPRQIFLLAFINETSICITFRAT